MNAPPLQPGRSLRSGRLAQSPAPWIAIAGLLCGAGWGSNQFTPMLLVYHARLALSTATLEALFGVYAAGLIPGLLLAGRLSDIRGRRPVGMAAAALSVLASVSLIGGGHVTLLLFVGRLLTGLGSGAAFTAGTAWLRESLARDHDAAVAVSGRRAAVAMTAGFALGPLVAGALAQWAPAATVVPYLPHIAVMLVVLVGVIRAPETIDPHSIHALPRTVPPESRRRFLRVVVPMAPWVFAAPAVAFALLPSVVGAGSAADGVALTAAITCLTALAGVLVQPLARRLEAVGHSHAVGPLGLLVLSAGLALAALTAAAGETWLLVPSGLLLGAAYGLCLVAGLLEVQHLAPAGSLGTLTARYYAITYTGFAAPYLLALASHVAGYPSLLLITCALAALTATGIRLVSPETLLPGPVVPAVLPDGGRARAGGERSGQAHR